MGLLFQVVFLLFLEHAFNRSGKARVDPETLRVESV